MGEHAYAHVPVLAGRVTALLVPALTGPAPGGRPPVLVDATLGRAGHARALLEACPGCCSSASTPTRPRSRRAAPWPPSTQAR